MWFIGLRFEQVSMTCGLVIFVLNRCTCGRGTCVLNRYLWFRDLCFEQVLVV